MEQGKRTVETVMRKCTKASVCGKSRRVSICNQALLFVSLLKVVAGYPERIVARLSGEIATEVFSVDNASDSTAL